jgi:CubicO group peptidase (beta-lactamase class C family)
MIRTAFAAAATLLLAVPASAQSQQERLDARYDRALAAGYKALMLCSAIATSEANGTTRTPESVHAWELTGVQQPLDAVIRDLPYRIIRASEAPGAAIQRVEVAWADDMPPRFAQHLEGEGCVAAPVGADPEAWAIAHARPVRAPANVAALRDPPPSPVRAVREAAFGGTYGKSARTTAVLITKDGKPIDWGATEGFSVYTPQRTWSVAKSIAATLIGAAVQRGEASVHASAGLGGDSQGDPRGAITIDHLLRMASGRYSDTPGNRTDPLYFGGARVDEVALDWPLVHRPGSVFRYANNDTLAAVKAIAKTFDRHPPYAVLDMIGMRSTVAEADHKGDFILSSQVWTSAHDLARFGQLYLDDGVLPSGERILPEGWVKYVSTPSGPKPLTGTFGYGAGFWLINKEEGVPSDTISANGNRGQYVVIVPSRQVVIVRRGEDPVGASFDIAAYTRDVLAALPAE